MPLIDQSNDFLFSELFLSRFGNLLFFIFRNVIDKAFLTLLAITCLVFLYCTKILALLFIRVLVRSFLAITVCLKLGHFVLNGILAVVVLVELNLSFIFNVELILYVLDISPLVPLNKACRGIFTIPKHVLVVLR